MVISDMSDDQEGLFDKEMFLSVRPSDINILIPSIHYIHNGINEGLTSPVNLMVLNPMKSHSQTWRMHPRFSDDSNIHTIPTDAYTQP